MELVQRTVPICDLHTLDFEAQPFHRYFVSIEFTASYLFAGAGNIVAYYVDFDVVIDKRSCREIEHRAQS